MSVPKQKSDFRTYVIAADAESITCLRCGMTSHNVKDIRYRYCGNCHEFHEMSRCDFCSAAEVPLPREYRSKADALVVQIECPTDATVVDDGRWVACAECAALIDARRWPELVERAVIGFLAQNPEVADNERNRKVTAERSRHLFRVVFGKEFA